MAFHGKEMIWILSWHYDICTCYLKVYLLSFITHFSYVHEMQMQVNGIDTAWCQDRRKTCAKLGGRMKIVFCFEMVWDVKHLVYFGSAT